MYQLIANYKKDLEGIEYQTYGVAFVKENKVLKSIEDVSTIKDEIVKLINLFNDLKVSEIHMEEIIYDFISC